MSRAASRNVTNRPVVSSPLISPLASPKADRFQLPPMLSPTLPAWVEEQSLPLIPKRMLSPTLPSLFDSPSEQGLKTESGKVDEASKRQAGSTANNNNNKIKTSNSNSNNNYDIPDSLPEKPKRQRYMVRLKLSKQKLKSIINSGSSSPNHKNASSSSNRENHRKKVVGLGITPPLPKSIASPIGTPKNASIGSTGSSPNNNNNNNTTNTAKRKPSSSVKNPNEVKKARINRSYSSSEESADEEKSKKVKTKTTNEKVVDQTTDTNDRPKTVVEGVPVKSETSTKESAKEESSKVSVTPKTSSIPSDQRERYSRLLRSKMVKWVGMAQEQKHLADSALRNGDSKLATGLLMDSLLAFIVGFDYEDRGDLMIKQVPHPNSWSTLLPFVSRIAKHFDRGKQQVDGWVMLSNSGVNSYADM